MLLPLYIQHPSSWSLLTAPANWRRSLLFWATAVCSPQDSSPIKWKKLAARLGNPFISAHTLTSFRAVPEILVLPGPEAPSYIPGSCSTTLFQKEHHQSPSIIQKPLQEKALLEGSQQLVFIQETDNCMQDEPQKMISAVETTPVL